MTKLPVINKYIDPMVDFGFKRIFKESGKKQLIIRPLNAVFYSALTITKEAERGDWDYNLHPVFFLGLLNFDIRHLDPEKARREQFIHKFSLREESSNEQMYRALQYAFLEIARFDKEKEACETFEERFLYMMKNLPTFAEEPELWDDPYFKEMMEEAEFANMTLAQRRQYAEAMKQRWDYRNQLTFAEQQGEARGREEGREEQAVLIARRMREMGMAEETIRAATGLSAEQFRIL